jgi:hypothetical protein
MKDRVDKSMGIVNLITKSSSVYPREIGVKTPVFTTHN